MSIKVPDVMESFSASSKECGGPIFAMVRWRVTLFVRIVGMAELCICIQFT